MLCHFSFAVRKTIYFIVSYDILHKCDVEVFKKEQEENKSATKIFPDKLSSQTCTFEKTLKPWQCAGSDNWEKR